MAEVLVTGANGFVGSHICEALLAGGYSVRALIRRTSDLTNIKGLPLNFVYGDIRYPEKLPDAVSGVVAVINNAGLVKARYQGDFHRVNCSGTENIIEAVRRHNPGLTRLVHISSTAASGPAPDRCPLTEEHPPNPLTAYGRSKLAAEQALMAVKDRVPSVILRPSAIYGPRDKEMYSFFKTIRLGIRPLFGNGENYINFTYVKDLARVVVKAISIPLISGNIYFVAEKKSYSYREAGAILSSIMKNKTITLRVPGFAMRIAGRVSEGVSLVRRKPSIFTMEKTREILARYWLFDTSKIERDLGFSATDFRSGAEETIAWYKENGWL
jgi:nucleoside-diphosphate-sugar epimerase